MPNLNKPTGRVEDSLKKRYFYKLATNFVSLVIGMGTQTIIPRGLGPEAYGNFGFLSTFFSQVVGFFNAGTSIGFFSKLSQRLEEKKLIRFYWGVVSVISLVLFAFVGGIFLVGIEEWLWPEQSARFIWLATIWGLLTWYTQIINKIVDAYGLTAKGELIRIGQKILGLVVILFMFFANRFSLSEFFLYHFFILVFLCGFWGWMLHDKGVPLLPKEKLKRAEAQTYLREFYSYSSPLVVYSSVTLGTGLADRWLLQNFAGSVQQGYFSLSYKIGAICFLFTNAMSPLLMREFSKAFGNHNKDRMRNLFKKNIPLLYTIAGFIAIFIAIQAEKVAHIFAGMEFKGATAAISVMALYPIHQTYGQLSGAVFYATEQTKLYRNIGISINLLSLPVAYLLLAPTSKLGMDLGALGLAVKMVGLQFIGVNLQLWYNTRYLDLSFWRFLGYQIFSIVILASLASFSAFGVDYFVDNVWVSIIASGILYGLGFLLIFYLFPSAFVAFSRDELWNQVKQLWSDIKGYLPI